MGGLLSGTLATRASSSSTRTEATRAAHASVRHARCKTTREPSGRRLATSPPASSIKRWPSSAKRSRSSAPRATAFQRAAWVRAATESATSRHASSSFMSANPLQVGHGCGRTSASMRSGSFSPRTSTFRRSAETAAPNAPRFSAFFESSSRRPSARARSSARVSGELSVAQRWRTRAM